jgi:hypothetical protein
MRPVSFQWFARSVVPARNPCKQAVLGLALLLAAGCGGAGSPKAQTVSGPGYAFDAPGGWQVVRKADVREASHGTQLVSVTRFPLLRAYRPALWAKVVVELDRAAAQVAAQQHGKVTDPRSVAVAGRQARRYDIAYERSGKQLVERIAFVLRAKTEFLLLCRYEAGGDTRACDGLLATFRLT